MAESNTQEHIGLGEPDAGKLPAGKAPPMPPAGPHDTPELIEPLATPDTGMLPPATPWDDIDAVSS